MWKPQEIIVHESVKDDPATLYFLNQCQGVPVQYVDKGDPKTVISASTILSQTPKNMLDKIIAGKQVVYIAPAGTAVDKFDMPDDRMLCPHFDRLKLASNGCFYQCDWCYLKLTYRAAFPFITVKAEHDKIKKQLAKRLSQTNDPVIFNSGEMADSLSMDHLTGAGREFIPWFGNTANGYLFMLTKSDNVNDILDLDHKGRTIVAWSINNDIISKKFEVGAPTFERRLNAAEKVQKAGYPLRIRLDPIVPFKGWKEAYAKTIKLIFDKVSPERITVGTLRFEKGLYDMRKTIFTTGPELPGILDTMEPMFEPKLFDSSKNPKSGKYSFPEEKRIEIFRYAVDEIRKYSDCKIALCKESAEVWEKTGLNASACSCVCQLDYADMLKFTEGVQMTEEKQRKPEIKNGIEFYPGSTNTLLIAPHGHSDDDENTAELTQKIADQLKCRAIINRTYRKPDDTKKSKRNGGKADLGNNYLDLNSIDQAKIHPDFIPGINNVVEDGTPTTVIWIHGIKNKNIKAQAKLIPSFKKTSDQLHALIGYGQGPDRSIKGRKRTKEEEKDSLTIGKDKAERLAQLLTASGMNTELTSSKAKNFCGRAHDNMNQWFIGKYESDSVQSLQIEIRKKDFRDTEKNILEKAKVMAKAISAFVQPVEKVTEPADKKEQPADQTLVTEETTDPDEIKGAIDEGKSESTPSEREDNVKEEAPEFELSADTDASEKVDTKSEPAEDDLGDFIDVGEETIEASGDENAITSDTETELLDDEDIKVENAYQHLRGIFKDHIQKAMLAAGHYLVKQFYDGNYKEAKKKKFTKNKSLSKLINRIQKDAQKKGDAPSRSWVYEAVNLAVDDDLFKQEKLPSVYRQLGHSHKVNLTNAPNDEVKRLLIEETVEENYTVAKLRERIREEKFKLDSNYIPVRETMSIPRLRELDAEVLHDLKIRTHKLTTDTRGYLGTFQGNLEKIDKMIAEKGSHREIISVSRRTDIPAHYSDWFFDRLKDGFVHVRKKINPNEAVPGDVLKVSLKPEHVRCFVFWTKNPGPMLDRLDELKDYHYYFQFTLTPYGPDIEKNLPPKKELEETFIKLSEKVGPDRVIWRYDPILLTDAININYHKEHFERLSEKFHDRTNRCVISFVDYKQISPTSKKELELKEIDLTGEGINHNVMREIASEFQQINKKFNFEIQTCAEAIDLTEFGITDTKCIDDKVIGRILGEEIDIEKDKSQREECGCVKSTDIGTYNTCAYGCLFCYATKQHAKALEYQQKHDVNMPLWMGNTDRKNIEKMILGNKLSPAALRKAIENNEWTLSKDNMNFSTGCSNACLYCYGRYMPFAQKLAEEAEAQGKVFDWGETTIRQKDVEKPQSLREGRVGFPTSHDIYPANLEDYLTVLGKLLKAGNRVLIITKPRLECIKAICEASAFFKDEILFRFTIGGKSKDVLSFWEPNAPSYDERCEALKYAFDKGFQTSVSMEPMLEYARAEEMVNDFMPYVSDAIWFGKMNHIPLFKDPDGRLKDELAKVEAGHADENIKHLYSIYKDNPKIKWKLAYKDILGIPLPPAPGMDV